jgi:hypothetical protein
VYVINTVLIHNVGVDDAADAVLFGVYVIVLVIEFPAHPLAVGVIV